HSYKLSSSAQTSGAACAADESEDLKHRRADRLTRERGARGVDEQARFDARFVGKGAQGSFARLGVERLGLFHLVCERGQQFFQARFFLQILGDRRLVKLKLVSEVSASLRGEIFKREEALADRFDRPFKPRALVRLETRAPQAARFEFGADERDEFGER